MDTLAVTLPQMLAAREHRAGRQRELAAAHPHAAVVTVTVLTPGPVKDTAWARQACEEGSAAITSLAQQRGWPIPHSELEPPAATGPTAFLALTADPVAVKGALVELEDTHPIGRLWDLDVAGEHGPLSRTELSLPPRRCLLCSEPAAACSRSRAHSLEAVLGAIDTILAGHGAARRRQP
ncbi:citrate lyase holo-[acyl-carrier protein] synthase [Gephyromycinifex aptenodytis]|uniref:citrate lyase holo-[acyl-carrier protein] synthase n=1 Tax=Gephyromycinifex aptenodytis TaxID=2716227 RepID=UPI0014460D3E|nr:citrate lyase holo-[acyl-carrier protein] synthase [Gephyromycinifex aptenodytis]